jgi:hypothetical protein
MMERINKMQPQRPNQNQTGIHFPRATVRRRCMARVSRRTDRPACRTLPSSTRTVTFLTPAGQPSPLTVGPSNRTVRSSAGAVESSPRAVRASNRGGSRSIRSGFYLIRCGSLVNRGGSVANRGGLIARLCGSAATRGHFSIFSQLFGKFPHFPSNKQQPTNQ